MLETLDLGVVHDGEDFQRGLAKSEVLQRSVLKFEGLWLDLGKLEWFLHCIRKKISV